MITALFLSLFYTVITVLLYDDLSFLGMSFLYFLMTLLASASWGARFLGSTCTHLLLITHDNPSTWR